MKTDLNLVTVCRIKAQTKKCQTAAYGSDSHSTAVIVFHMVNYVSETSCLFVYFPLHRFPVYKQAVALGGKTDHAEIGIVWTGKMIGQAIIPHLAADFWIGALR